MKLQKIVLYNINFENLDSDSIIYELGTMDYMHNKVASIETVDIGEWADDHILNKSGTPITKFEEYFKK